MKNIDIRQSCHQRIRQPQSVTRDQNKRIQFIANMVLNFASTCCHFVAGSSFVLLFYDGQILNHSPLFQGCSQSKQLDELKESMDIAKKTN